jgi:hypothetical protein
MPQGQGAASDDGPGRPRSQTKILLDSNSYFRLAKGIHPLLFQEFGDQRYCLYVLPELQREYDRQPRLRAKFPWVDDPDFRANRQRQPKLSKQQKRALDTTYDVLWDHVQTTLPGPSRVDVTVLTYGYVLGVQVVTDDGDMRALGTVFGISLMTTVELLALMHACGHVDMAKVRAVASYLAYLPDLPKGFAADYLRLFGEAAPL